MGCRIDKHSRKQEQKRIRRFKNLKKPWYSPKKKYQECSVYRWEEHWGLGDTVWGDQIPNLQNNGESTWELNLAEHKVQADIKSLLAKTVLIRDTSPETSNQVWGAEVSQSLWWCWSYCPISLMFLWATQPSGHSWSPRQKNELFPAIDRR